MPEIIDILLSRAGWLIMMACFVGLALGWAFWGRRLSELEDTIDAINVDRSHRRRHAQTLQTELDALARRSAATEVANTHRRAAMRAQIDALENADAAKLARDLEATKAQFVALQDHISKREPEKRQEFAKWQRAVRDRDAYIARLERRLKDLQAQSALAKAAS